MKSESGFSLTIASQPFHRKYSRQCQKQLLSLSWDDGCGYSWFCQGGPRFFNNQHFQLFRQCCSWSQWTQRLFSLLWFSWSGAPTSTCFRWQSSVRWIYSWPHKSPSEKSPNNCVRKKTTITKSKGVPVPMERIWAQLGFTASLCHHQLQCHQNHSGDQKFFLLLHFFGLARSQGCFCK